MINHRYLNRLKPVYKSIRSDDYYMNMLANLLDKYSKITPTYRGIVKCYDRSDIVADFAIVVDRIVQARLKHIHQESLTCYARMEGRTRKSLWEILSKTAGKKPCGLRRNK